MLSGFAELNVVGLLEHGWQRHVEIVAVPFGPHPAEPVVAGHVEQLAAAIVLVGHAAGCAAVRDVLGPAGRGEPGLVVPFGPHLAGLPCALIRDSSAVSVVD